MQTPRHAITQFDLLSLSPSHPAWPGVQGCSWCTSLALDLQMRDEYIWPHSHKERADLLLSFCCTSFAGQSLVNHTPFPFVSLRCSSGTGEHNVLFFVPWGTACASGNYLLISVFIVKLPVSELLTNSLRCFSLQYTLSYEQERPAYVREISNQISWGTPNTPGCRNQSTEAQVTPSQSGFGEFLEWLAHICCTFALSQDISSIMPGGRRFFQLV